MIGMIGGGGNIGKSYFSPCNSKNKQGSPDAEQKNEKGEKPEDRMIDYVCSKGHTERHRAKDSHQAVRQHEQRHIDEYEAIATKLGLRTISPEIRVDSGFDPAAKNSISTGGEAKCRFAADIDGTEIGVNVTKDGQIADPDIAKRLDEQKLHGKSSQMSNAK